MVRNLTLFAFSIALLVVQSSLGVLVPTYPFTPNLVLPVVMFLGGSPEISVARGGLLSLVFGWTLDQFCGTPMGLSTAVMVATYLASRGAVHQLFLRGVGFQVTLSFVVALLSAGSLLALRAIFAPQEAFPLGLGADGWVRDVVGFLTGTGENDAPRVGSAVEIAVTLTASALATAIASPFVFSLLRRIEALGTRGRASAETAAA
jgi:hypothetical protein